MDGTGWVKMGWDGLKWMDGMDGLMDGMGWDGMGRQMDENGWERWMI